MIVPFGCQVKLFISKHSDIIALLAILFTFGNYYIWKTYSYIKKKNTAQVAYRKVLEALHGRTKIRIKELNGMLEKNGDYNGWNNQEVWEYIDTIRKNDEQIYVFVEEYNGLYEKCWTIKAAF